MSILKTLARNFVFPAITAFGIEKLFSLFSKNQYLILMYHGVVKNKNLKLSANHCSLKEFETEIEYLKNNFDILPLRQVFEQSRKKITPKRRTIAITFDDGYENNYTNAYPVLKKYDVPATIFVVGSCVLNPDHVLWYDFVDMIKHEIDFSLFPSIQVNLPGSKTDELREIRDLGRFRSFLKSIDTVSKQAVLEKIILKEKSDAIISRTDLEYRKMLNPAQLAEMAGSGLIEIGSHSLTHPNLDTLDDATLMHELGESKKLLEQAIKSEIVSIAFPDGAYNENVKSTSLSLGYQNLLSVIPRLAGDSSDASIRPRFCISNTTITQSNIIQIHLSFAKVGF